MENPIGRRMFDRELKESATRFIVDVGWKSVGEGGQKGEYPDSEEKK
jgi:hypothetical protein